MLTFFRVLGQHIAARQIAEEFCTRNGYFSKLSICKANTCSTTCSILTLHSFLSGKEPLKASQLPGAFLGQFTEYAVLKGSGGTPSCMRARREAL